jgi:hypothetical protein
MGGGFAIKNPTCVHLRPASFQAGAEGAEAARTTTPIEAEPGGQTIGR